MYRKPCSIPTVATIWSVPPVYLMIVPMVSTIRSVPTMYVMTR